MAEHGGYNRPMAEWIVEIQQTLGCINYNRVKAGSICRVPPIIKEAEAIYRKGYTPNYRPQLVAMGPFHRATTTSDLSTMEEIKWHFMHNLLSRPSDNHLKRKTVEICGDAVKGIWSIIRESYGEKIEMGSEELAEMMLLDACFILEFLLRLAENNTNPPSDDPKKIVRVLADLMLLENQIPFLLLTVLYSKLVSLQEDSAHQQPLPPILALSNEANKQLSRQKLAELLLGFSVAGAGAISFISSTRAPLIPIHVNSKPYNAKLPCHCGVALESSNLLESLLRLLKLTILKAIKEHKSRIKHLGNSRTSSTSV